MKKYKLREIFLASILPFCLILIFLIYTGTFFSGYHLVDDHEFIGILYDLRQNNLIDTLFEWTNNSFILRFRPLYYVIRVILTSIFKLNFNLWYLWKALEISLSTTFMYFTARNLKCDKVVSTLFSMFIVIGLQTAVWYRLGPQEGTGLLFLSISMFFITEQCMYKRRKLNIFLIIIFSLLMSLIKESFILMLPCLLIFKLILEQFENKKDSFKDCLIKNRYWVIYFMLLFIIEIFVIVFVIGTNKISYGGFDSKMPINYYINGIIRSLLTREIVEPMVLSVFVVGIVLGHYHCFKNREKILFFEFLLFPLSIFFFQFLLYAKSGMWERYVIPTSVGYSFIIFVFSNCFLKKERKLFNLILLLSIIIIAVSVRKSIPLAKDFSNNGKNINEFINYVEEEFEDNNEILICLEEELSYSASWKLKYDGYESTYYSYSLNDYRKPLNKSGEYESTNKINYGDYDLIVYSNEYSDMIFIDNSLNKDNYIFNVYGKYIVAKKSKL